MDEDDDAAVHTQTTQHLTYAATVDSASSLVENYLTLRLGDPASVIVETPEEITRRQALQAAEQRLRDARVELEEAEKAYVDLGGQITPQDGSEIGPSDSASQIGARPIHKFEHYPIGPALPADAWIETYLAGQEKPFVREEGDRSSVTVQLEVYSGRALDWFSWIGMFYALVHIARKTASEKLAILKNYLKGDLADIVHGHGGGEQGYKEALQRLKSTCGNRTVIHAAHLQALDRMEAPRNDPQSFKRFAERVRTHVFNLATIGESGHVDIIERLTLKLQLTDHLAWNDKRGLELDQRTINDLGRWLTTRAVSYQNAYAITDEQQHPASKSGQHWPQGQQRSQHRRSARTHHGMSSVRGQTDHGSTELKERRPADAPQCFKCEGAHRLEECQFFRDLPVSDRMTFVQRRGLCYGCFGIRHGAMHCTFKKTCGVEGCRLNHHRLLHRNQGHSDRTVRPHTLRSTPRQIGFKIIRLDALDAE